MANTQKVIATAGLISVSIGSANSIVKYKKPPSTRFLIGSGVAFLIFSAMGNSDSMAEVAKGLALGVMTTIILGEGGGVMTYFAGAQEMDTTKPKTRSTGHSVSTAPPPAHANDRANSNAITVNNPSGQFRRDSLPAQPFFTGRK